MRTLTAILIMTFVGLTTGGAMAEQPATTMWSPKAVAELQQRALRKDSSVIDVLTKLRKQAAEQMTTGPFSVTDKEFLPPSGDKHDLSTLGRYYWPNPKTPDGMPWVVIDGKTNPDYFGGKTGDTQRLVDFWNAAIILSYDSYFNGNEVSAERATLLLRTWFLDPKTRMKPNANYAARLPGVADGRCYGMHSTVRPFIEIMDAIALLKSSKAWTTADQRGMEQWFADYLKWTLTSDFGKEEAGQPNNHSTAYVCLIARMALFTGQNDLARKTLQDSRKPQIDVQIEPDGNQPMELKRATSWKYVMYREEFLFRMAMLGDAAGVDLWNYRTADRRSIRRSLDFILSYVIKDGQVDKKALEQVESDRLGPSLQIAARVYSEPKYLAAMHQIGYDGKLRFGQTPVNGVLGAASKLELAADK